MYENFSELARRVVQLAAVEAKRYRHDFLSPEHILLALLKVGEGVAAKVLEELGLTLPQIRMEIERVVQSGPEDVTLGEPTLTPWAKGVLERRAPAEAKRLGAKTVTTGHLLLALVSKEEGVVYNAILARSVTSDEVREATLRQIAHDGSESEHSEQVAVDTPKSDRALLEVFSGETQEELNTAILGWLNDNYGLVITLHSRSWSDGDTLHEAIFYTKS